LFSAALREEDIHAIRTAALFSLPLGNDRFREQIEKTTGQKTGQPKRGRPLKMSSC
jgi:putative transposase